MKKIYVDNCKKHGSVIHNFILASVCVCAVIVTLTIVLISNKYEAESDVPKTTSNNNDIMVVDEIQSEDTELLDVKESESEKQDYNKSGIGVDYEFENKYIAPCSGEILNGYSPRVPVYSETLDDWRIHSGIDIAAPLNSDVYAVNDGVVEIFYDDLRWGSTIVINHENNLKSIYSNLAKQVFVQSGQKIKKGDVIAKIGDTALFETVADTHLHFEMKINDTTVNPLDYFNIE